MPSGSSRFARFCQSLRPLPAGECAHSPRGTYHAHALVIRHPERASKRARRDAVLLPEIKRVWDDNLKVYGVRKVWHQLRREGFDVARCTVERLMKRLGLQGVIRGKGTETTVSDKSDPCPEDKVNRQFRAPAPNRLWVSDFTYVSTWQGFVYVAFVIDTFADRIVGWKASRSAKTDFVLPSRQIAVQSPAGQRMPWSKRFTIEGRLAEAVSFITATVGFNTFP